MSRHAPPIVARSTGVLLLATMLTGCTGSDSESADPSVCGEGTSHGCFDGLTQQRIADSERGWPRS